MKYPALIWLYLTFMEVWGIGFIPRLHYSDFDDDVFYQMYESDFTPPFYNYETEPTCDLTIRQSGHVIDHLATVFGDDFVSITCDARCKAPGLTPALEWYRDPSNTPIPSTMGRFYSYSRSSDREQRLIFPHFHERDAGSYTCKGWLGPMIGWVKKSVELLIGCLHPKISCDVNRCIPPEYRCDGIRQCIDGFDEYDCGASVCLDWEFYCDGRCRSSTIRCDGQFDCFDGLDELDCEQGCNPEQEYRCWDGSCIPLIWVCDDDYDCPYGEDELHCTRTSGTASYSTPGLQSTSTGRSYAISTARETGLTTTQSSTPSETPVYSKTDESFTATTTIKSPTESSRPDITTGETKTLKSTASETTITSTVDSSPSPVNSLPSTQDLPGCNPEQEYQCSDGSCISLARICDGLSDCLHSEDELSCTETIETAVYSTPDFLSTSSAKSSTVESTLPSTPSPTTKEVTPGSSTEITVTVCQGMFTCGDGICIALSRICDNIPDCKDDTDEKNCGDLHKSCAENQRVCKDGKQCINLSQWGDGKCDCNDGSDEMKCG